MKRYIGILLTVASLVTVGVLTSSAAAAHDDACTGTGTATLGTGLGIPTVVPGTGFAPLKTTFHFELSTGVCVVKGVGGLIADGYVDGNCGLSSGGGTTNNDHDFAFTSTGTVLVVTGEVTGVVSAAVDATRTGNSCLDKSAQHFLITGAVTKTHVTPCSTDTAALTTNCNVV